MTLTNNLSLWVSPSPVDNFYPTETQTYQVECLSLNINEMVDSTNITIYPIPSKGDINIISDSEIISIEITNIIGQNIKNYYPNKIETSISLEKDGIYLLKIKTKSGIKTSKIVISN